MKTSKRAVQFIRDHEGLRLTAYKDAVGVWTIGYGHTSDPKYPVRPGMHITKAKAEEMLAWDIAEAETVLDKAVKVPLNGNEYGALISLMFNIGNGAFLKSTLLKRLNRGQRRLNAEFGMWVKGTKNGKRVTLSGLVRRRAEEAALFATPEALGDKVVKQPPIVGATEETTDARDAKKGVAEDKSKEPPIKSLLGGALAALLAPILQVYAQLKDAFGEAGPVAIVLSVLAMAAIAYVVFHYVRAGRADPTAEAGG